MLTLTKDQVITLQCQYATLCGLRGRIERVVHPHIVQDLVDTADHILAIIEPALRQLDADHDTRVAHYDAVAQQHEFYAVWRVFDAVDLTHYSPLAGTTLVYRGKHYPLPPVEKLTWLQLYAAANAAICACGSTDHIFIEGFGLNNIDGQLVLLTGS